MCKSVFSSIFQQSLKKKKKSEGKVSEKDEMGEKEKSAFEAQLAKEAEIRDRLKEVSFLVLHVLHTPRQVNILSFSLCFL